MADVKWIKLTTDMFDNRKIKHLRRLPDGNNIVLIWVMLLTMAGRCNAGGMIFLTENIPYTTKMLADELDFEENTVILALQALEQFNMISTRNNFYSITGWEEYQNIDGLEKIREQNRIRKQKQREKQKLLDGVSRDSHGTVTQCHATDKEREKEEEKEIDIDNLSIYQEAEPKKEMIDRMIDENIISSIHSQIEYDLLTERIDYDEIDLAVSCIADLYTAKEPLQFNGRHYSPEYIRRQAEKINSSHVEYVFECLEQQKEKVRNIRSYLLTAIFNAPDTMGSYYKNKVIADGAIW